MSCKTAGDLCLVLSMEEFFLSSDWSPGVAFDMPALESGDFDKVLCEGLSFAMALLFGLISSRGVRSGERMASTPVGEWSSAMADVLL